MAYIAGNLSRLIRHCRRTRRYLLISFVCLCQLSYPHLNNFLQLLMLFQAYSFKFKQAGVTYEIALAIWENRVVHVNGPFLAGTTDIQIFRKRLKGLIPNGRKVVADQGASNCCAKKHSSLLLNIHLTLTFFSSNFLSTKEKEAWLASPVRWTRRNCVASKADDGRTRNPTIVG